MGKFTREDKEEMIGEYNKERMSLNAISEKHGISKSYLRQILRQYENEGPDVIGTGKRGKELNRYPGQFRLSVVKERMQTGMGYRALARKYHITHAVIMRWERIYLEEGEEELLKERRWRQTKEENPNRGRPRKYSKTVEQDLLDEVQQLRMENEYLKKLNALIQDGRKSQQLEKRK